MDAKRNCRSISMCRSMPMSFALSSLPLLILKLANLKLANLITVPISLISHKCRITQQVLVVTSVALTLIMVSNHSIASENTTTANNQTTIFDTVNQTLMIDMTPAMCSLYPVRADMNQCLSRYHITIEALDLGYRCVSSEIPIINPVQKRVLQNVMPDTDFINQAWRRYSACSPYDAKSYFRQLNRLANNLNIPLRLNASRSFVIERDLLLDDMRRANPTIRRNSIQLTCQPRQGHVAILTKMKVCYTGNQFTDCPVPVSDTCGNDFVIWGATE